MTDPEVIGIDTLEQNLELIVSNIVHTVQRQQATASLPLHLDREWIVSGIREQISNDGYVLKPTNTKPSNDFGPFFSTLPPELRNMVFADCLKSGHPQFMACSRAARNEGLQQIWDKAVYRMNFGIKVRMNLASGAPTGAPDCLPPPQDIANKIQILKIRVKGTVGRARDIWADMDLDAIKRFGGSEIRRKSCKVCLEVRFDKRVCINTEVFQALRTLVGFERVELQIVFAKSTLPPLISVAHRNRVRGPLKKAYHFCAHFLFPALGRPSIGRGEKGHCLVFNPRMATTSGG